MINWQSILSSFDDKPTLLEWLKKVQKALNESALTAVTVTQEKSGRVNSITLSFNFQDGTKIVAPAFTVNDGVNGIGITDLVNTDLTNSNLVVTYDTIDGLHVFATQNMSYSGGNHASGIEFRLPIMPGNGIVINKKANAEEVEVKIDSSKVISAIGFAAYDSMGIQSYLYPDNIQYWDYEGNQYMLVFPSKNGTLTTDNSFKTLFGKSIVGTGNIGLYRHNICFTSANQDKIVKIRFIVPSSNNLKVSSLADLKTLLGNTFTYPVNGGTGDNKSVYEITETGYKAGATPYALYDTVTPYPAGTWADNVETI